MTTPSVEEGRYFLSSLVEHEHSPQVRTAVLTPTNFDAALNENPAAITLAPPGVLSGDLLLVGVVDKPDLFKPFLKHPSKVNRWRCYALNPGEQQVELQELVDEQALRRRVVKLAKLFAQFSTARHTCAFVPDVDFTPARDKKMRSFLMELFVQSSVKKAFVDRDGIEALASKTDDDDVEAADRETLIRVRKKMLDEVGSYASEDLAAAADSFTSNPSQFAADQRRTGKLFGVRFGQAWRYPKFQFDAKRQTIPEMKDVLAALSPDAQGWDRLHWFLTPHEKLKQRTPLEIWKTDRKKVIDAANMERWNARD